VAIERRGRVFAEYRDFSAEAVQDAIVGDVLAFGLMLKKRKLQDAKLLTVEVFRGGGCCNLGLLQEKALFGVARGNATFGLLPSVEVIK
jgi:hypothetical protein